MIESAHLTRRQVLLAGAGALTSLTSAGFAAAAPSEPTRLLLAPATAKLTGVEGKATAVWTYNGTVPGPVLRYRQGATATILADNRLPSETTIHWHGLRVPNAMDGVPHLTQNPIAESGQFTYSFELPDAGTYWYHPHLRSSEQIERGLAGAFIVDEVSPPAVDRDLVWILDDWRLEADGSISERFDNLHDMAHAGRIGDVVTVNGAPPPDFEVRRGERIRLRLINVANARIFSLRFAGHTPSIVAYDGQAVEPHPPPGERVVLGPGMRADLILDCSGDPGSRHEIRDDSYRNFAFRLATVVYGAETMRAEPLQDAVRLAPNPLPQPDLDRAERHEVVFEGGMMGRMPARMDRAAMIEAMRQGRIWYLNGEAADGHRMKPMLALKRGRSCILTMRNETAWHHPMHLHGHVFRILRRNGEPRRFAIWRDTVLVAPHEVVDIAFVADNPGDWMFHCHVLEHQAGGMMGVVHVE
jgi:FtsP/CotA-like multicopper oxidase with cupredoxin domain